MENYLNKNPKGEISSKVLIQITLVTVFFIGVVWGVGRMNFNKTTELSKKSDEKSYAGIQGNKDLINNIPLNKKVNMARSGKKKTADGNLIESSIVFYSKANISENKKFYENWAKKNNWQKTENYNGADNTLSLLKGSGTLDVSFESLENGSVKITLVYRTI